MTRKKYSLLSHTRNRNHAALLQAATFDLLEQGLVIVSPSGTIVDCNAAAAHILQRPRDQIIKRHVIHLSDVLGNTAIQWMQALRSLSVDDIAAHKDLADWTFSLMLKDRYIDLHLSAVHRGQHVLGAVLELRDMTDQRMRINFIENVSSELRTPLTPIIGYSDMLVIGAMGELSPIQLEMAQIISDNAHRLSDLLSDILTVTQLNNHRMTLFTEWVDLNDVIPPIVNSIAQQDRNQAKKMELVIAIDAALPLIQVDHERFSFLVRNLVDNAFNYTPSGGRISVSARLELENNHQSILITIADTGAGIPDDFRERVWLKFERNMEHALRFDIVGTGLGLPIAKELVELHQGQIWFDSQVEIGTSFYVRLPIAQPSR